MGGLIGQKSKPQSTECEAEVLARQPQCFCVTIKWGSWIQGRFTIRIIIIKQNLPRIRYTFCMFLFRISSKAAKRFRHKIKLLYRGVSHLRTAQRRETWACIHVIFTQHHSWLVFGRCLILVEWPAILTDDFREYYAGIRLEGLPV
jgi:hypothetical protein